jgi:hypothetical protein
MAWNGRAWAQQQEGGRWTQKDHRGGGGGGSQWNGKWEPVQKGQWSSWWPLPQTQRKQQKASVGQWQAWPSYSQPASAAPNAKHTTPVDTGTKKEAAVKATLLRQQIQELGTQECLVSLKASLTSQLKILDLKAFDKRTSTQKLLQAEQFVKRKVKMLERERAKLLELTESIAELQACVDKEIENIAELRAEVGAEQETMESDRDSEMSSVHAQDVEVVRLEAQELELRRKRGAPHLSEAQRAALDVQANMLSEQAGQKRRKMESGMAEDA